jgi:hypothetical protein
MPVNRKPVNLRPVFRRPVKKKATKKKKRPILRRILHTGMGEEGGGMSPRRSGEGGATCRRKL